MKENRKSMTGVVVSDKMQKTVVVTVEKVSHHPRYHKTISKVTRYKAHDESNASKIGDVVRLVETRPLSKDKRWQVVEVVGKTVVAQQIAEPDITPDTGKTEKVS